MKDIGWKILSVLISVCLWFVVINIQNPVENRSFNVPVVFQNRDVLIENGLVMVNDKDFTNLKVSVKVRGQRMSLDRLNTKNIEAVVDLKKIAVGTSEAKEISAPISVTLPGIVGDTCQIISRDPQYVNLVVDNVITEEKAVEIKTNGTTQSGYVMSKPVANPAVVKVSGAQADVERVASVQAEITLESIAKDTVFKAVPVAYDANGEKINNVLLSEKEISVSINVSLSKKVPVKVMTQGLPAYRYKVEKISWTPEYIEVVGDEEVLNTLNEITLPVVNIQNKTESVEEEYSVSRLLPEGIKIKDGTAKTVAVKVQIAQEVTKLFHIPSNQISTTGTLPENLKATFKPVGVDLMLSGTEEVISAVDTSKILGTIDITNLTVGEQNVTIQFTLPEGTELSGSAPTAVILITDETSQTEPEEPNTEEEIPPTEQPENQNEVPPTREEEQVDP